MIPYLIPLILIIAGIMFYDAQDRTTNRRWLYWFLYAYIVVLFGLRYRIGWDTLSYMMFYEDFPTFATASEASLDEFGQMQSGFQFLWLCLKSADAPFWVYQLIHSTFINAVVFWFIKRNTRYWFCGLLIYYLCYCFYFNTEIMRESIAIAIFMMSYKYLVKRRWIPFYISVAAAYMFHVSALILAAYPLAIIFNLRFDKKLLICVFVLVGVLLLARGYVLELASMLGQTYGQKMMIYSSSFDMGNTNNNWLIFRFFRFVLFPTTLCFVWKYRFKREIRYEPMVCLYIIFGAGILVFQEMFVRMTNYPTPFFLIWVTSILGSSIRLPSRRKMMAYTMLAALLLLNTYDNIRMTIAYHMYAPYSWIVNPTKDKVRESQSDF